jgi:Ca-activated chloride channel family protein
MRKQLVWLLLTAVCSTGCSRNLVGASGHRASLLAAPMTIAGAAPPAADAASGDAFHDWGKNPWVDATKDHLSTFAADVDTASYTFARRTLVEGQLPAPAGVRVEEFVNYFHYAFPPPQAGSPFSVVMDAAPSPFRPGRHILRVGVATREKAPSERKPEHLVFLVDVSGSMMEADRLPLAKQALRILTENLQPGDTVALVTYASGSRIVLRPTGVEHRRDIEAAIGELESSGSTAMGKGLDSAYELAMAGVAPGAVSRVIVCTDGDANVGPHSARDLLDIIEARAKAGVTLSTIGFGRGNYKDSTLEQLADRGNGNNYYIDSLAQARRVFQQQLGSTLEVVAKDVKLQVDFDASRVARYRLIGYEDRTIADDDFRKDAVDAGEMGAGHQVTAMYELELAANAPAGSLATVRVRHKAPDGDVATEAAFPMTTAVAPSFADAPADLRFAFAVAAFADLLRGNGDARTWSLVDVRGIAAAAAGNDTDRAELVSLIERATKLSPPQTASVAK